jgi:hypothetical protein
VAARADTGHAQAAAAAVCDHDGKASGRLVLERGAVRHEIVCDCGQVLAVLGRQDYRLGGHGAHARGAARERWRRSRAFLTSVGGRRGQARPAARASRLAGRS